MAAQLLYVSRHGPQPAGSVFEQQSPCAAVPQGTGSYLLQRADAPLGFALCCRNFVLPCRAVACLAGHAWAWWDYSLALFFWLPCVPGLSAAFGFPLQPLCLCKAQRGNVLPGSRS